jgi:hypothetical protein
MEKGVEVSSKRCQLVTGAFLALAVAAFVPPAASATDLRSPDTRDAAIVMERSPAATDLRSPDTRDASSSENRIAAFVDLRSPDTRTAGTAQQRGPVLVDLRSPDSRDAARGYRPRLAIEVVRVVGPSGFDWRDAGIGALGAFAVALLGAGTVLAVLRHHRSRFAAL